MGALAHILIFVGLGLMSTLLTSYYILDTMNGTIMNVMMLEAIGNTVWFPNHYTLLMKYVLKEKSGEFFGSISAISTYINKIQGCAKEV